MYLLLIVNRSIKTITKTVINVKFLPINLENLSVRKTTSPIIIALKTS